VTEKHSAEQNPDRTTNLASLIDSIRFRLGRSVTRSDDACRGLSGWNGAWLAVLKWVALVGACAAWGLGIDLTVRSHLGVAPWEVFHLALSTRSGISQGRIGIAASLLIVVLSFISARIKPGWATLVLGFCVGLFIDLWYLVVPRPNALGVRLFMLLSGIATVGFATALYLRLDLGAGPRDSAMFAVAKLTGRSLRLSRTLIELTVLATGIALGGPFGVGTLIYALTVGPVVQFFLKLLRVQPGSITRNDAP
jgi:uncharacterized membrane protein YczE